MFKKYFTDFINQRTAKLHELEERNEKATTADEARSIGREMNEVRSEIRDAEKNLQELEAEEARSKNPFPEQGNQRSNADKHMEYRKAFKEFVQRGTPIPSDLVDLRAAGPTLASEISALIPVEIMNEVLHADSTSAYGQIYNRVRKMGVPFGIQFPISQLKAEFKWINETDPISPDKAGNAKTFVTFGANIGSVSFSQSILVTIEALPVFEQEMAKLLREAFYKAMDNAIMLGNGTGKPTGILVDSRVTKKVSFGAGKKDIDDWKKWNSLFWSQIPDDKENGTLIVNKNTWYSHLLNMSDANNKPLAYETISQMGDKGILRTFMGREVVLVGDALLKNFDLANTDGNDVFALWGDLNDYGLNNLQAFGLKKWEDNKTHQTITEGLVVCDGHVLESYGFIKAVKAV